MFLLHTMSFIHLCYDVLFFEGCYDVLITIGINNK